VSRTHRAPPMKTGKTCPLALERLWDGWRPNSPELHGIEAALPPIATIGEGYRTKNASRIRFGGYPGPRARS